MLMRRLKRTIGVGVFLMLWLSMASASQAGAPADSRGCPAVWNPQRQEWRWMTDDECATFKNGGVPPAPKPPVDRNAGTWFAVVLEYQSMVGGRWGNVVTLVMAGPWEGSRGQDFCQKYVFSFGDQLREAARLIIGEGRFHSMGCTWVIF